MRKENSEGESESDLEIDVENINENGNSSNKMNDGNDNLLHITEGNRFSSGDNSQQCLLETEASEAKDKDLQMKTSKDLSELSEEVSKQLMSMEAPTSEFMLAQDTITDLERCINSEFFEGRPTKTPGRYLKVKLNFLLLS